MKKEMLVCLALALAVAAWPKAEEKKPEKIVGDPEPILIVQTVKPDFIPVKPVQTKLNCPHEPVSEKQYRNDIPLSPKLQDDVGLVCDEFGLDENILYAVMSVESNFHVDARNGNCVGLMQINTINSEYLREKIGVTNLENPSENIRAGAYMLSEQLLKHDLKDCLMIYNNGPMGARKLWDQGIRDTGYTRKVLAAMEEFSNLK